MKASDLINVLHHIPGETIVEDIVIDIEKGVLKASHALENLITGKPVHDGAQTKEPPKTELRTDGPTLEEFVAAGYLAEHYPPPGYAIRTKEERKD